MRRTRFLLTSGSLYCANENVPNTANKDQRGNGPHYKNDGHDFLLVEHA